MAELLWAAECCEANCGRSVRSLHADTRDAWAFAHQAETGHRVDRVEPIEVAVRNLGRAYAQALHLQAVVEWLNRVALRIGIRP